MNTDFCMGRIVNRNAPNLNCETRDSLLCALASWRLIRHLSESAWPARARKAMALLTWLAAQVQMGMAASYMTDSHTLHL